MNQVDKLNKEIEVLRRHLNKLVKRKENTKRLLFVSQELDRLLLEYYEYMDASEDNK